jgi:hypothetical protein
MHDNGIGQSWKAIAQSAIGTRHQSRGQSCQDHGAVLIQPTIVFGAVADGAGSAQFSEIGATLAVNTALAYLQTNLYKAILDTDPPTESEIQPLFEQMVTQVVEVLEQTAKDGDYPLRELGCTLLSFIATDHWLAAMQIGDGFIVVQSDAAADFKLLFEPDKGEFINETMFVTSQGALEQMQCCTYPWAPRFICAATDGLEKVAIRYQDWQPFAPFFKPLVDCLDLIAETDDQHTYLRAFLESDRLNARTDDDKTLVIALQPQGALSPPEESQVAPSQTGEAPCSS